MAKEPSELARKYIDASLQARARKGRAAKPSKAMYTRAVRLAKQAIEDLTVVARRVQGSASR